MEKNNLHKVNWDIISDILTNKATEAQKTEFNNWLNSDKDNSVYFKQIKELWLKTGSLTHCYSKETNDAWANVISRTTKKIKKSGKLRRFLYFTIPAAASLLLLFFVGKSILFPEKVTLSTNNNSIIAYNLPDNSVVDLNHNSELKYNKKFLRKKRELWLTGEAFFDVEKMEDKPFIIHTHHGSFKVLGTSFNITSYSNDKLLSLYVKTGMVEFFPKDKKGSVKVKKGYQLHYDKKKRKVIKTQDESENYMAWKTGILEFTDTGLDEVAIILEKTFNTKIIIEDEKIKQLQLTANFENQSLDKILKVIAFTFDLEVEQTNEEIKLKQIEE